MEIPVNMIFPCHVNSVICKTEYPSIINAGIFPSELASENSIKDTFPIAENILINPDGINGSNLKERIRRKAFFPSASNNLLTFGIFSIEIVFGNFLKPCRYT